MGMIDFTILNATVANQTRKAVCANNADGCVENNHTRENDRDEMWLGFFFGLMLGIGYLLAFRGSDISDSFLSVFWDGAYLMIYFICQLAVYGVSQDDKQPRKAIRTSLLLSSMLAVVMLVPFILDMNMNFNVHEFVAGVGGYVVGHEVHTSAIYHDYVDYGQILCVAIMVIWCAIDAIGPLFKLRKMKKELG